MKAPDNFGSLQEAIRFLLDHTTACYDTIERLEKFAEAGFTLERVLPHLEDEDVEWALVEGFEDWVDRLPVHKLGVCSLLTVLGEVPELRRRLPESLLSGLTEADWVEIAEESGAWQELGKDGLVKQFPESFDSVQEFLDCLAQREIVNRNCQLIRDTYTDCSSIEELRERIRPYDIYWLCRMGWKEWMKTFPMQRITSSGNIYHLALRFPDLTPYLNMQRLWGIEVYSILYHRPEMHSLLDLEGLSPIDRGILVRIQPELEEVFLKKNLAIAKTERL